MAYIWIIGVGMGAYYYYTQMVTKAIVPEADLLGVKKPRDLDLLKAVTMTRQPGAMTNIIQDQSMTGKSKANVRNPYGPPNSREHYINAPEVVQKPGYQKDYKRLLHGTQVRFSTYNDHLNSFTQNHSPMDGILDKINNFSNGMTSARRPR